MGGSGRAAGVKPATSRETWGDGTRVDREEEIQFFQQEGVRMGGSGRKGRVLIVMHCRSRMTIDPRIPTLCRDREGWVSSTRKSGFQRPGRHCLHQA